MITALTNGFYFDLAVLALLAIIFASAFLRRRRHEDGRPLRVPGYCVVCGYHRIDHERETLRCPKVPSGYGLTHYHAYGGADDA